MSDRVSVTIDGGVADVRLNRPDKINALDPAMFTALVEAGEALKTHNSVGGVLLSGGGPAVCARLHLAHLPPVAGPPQPARRPACLPRSPNMPLLPAPL